MSEHNMSVWMVRLVFSGTKWGQNVLTKRTEWCYDKDDFYPEPPGRGLPVPPQELMRGVAYQGAMDGCRIPVG
jgi:hypothetical protein